MKDVEYVPLGYFRLSPSLSLVVSLRKYFKSASVVLAQFVPGKGDEVLGYFKKDSAVHFRPDQFFEFVSWLEEIKEKIKEVQG